MIKNKPKLSKFYQKLTEQEDLPYEKALSIYEALHSEAVRLGSISSQNILDGLEVDIRIAKAINSLT